GDRLRISRDEALVAHAPSAPDESEPLPELVEAGPAHHRADAVDVVNERVRRIAQHPAEGEPDLLAADRQEIVFGPQDDLRDRIRIGRARVHGFVDILCAPVPGGNPTLDSAAPNAGNASGAPLTPRARPTPAQAGREGRPAHARPAPPPGPPGSGGPGIPRPPCADSCPARRRDGRARCGRGSKRSSSRRPRDTRNAGGRVRRDTAGRWLRGASRRGAGCRGARRSPRWRSPETTTPR